MKRFDLPLWSDTVFVFSAAFLLFFCIFRFYLNGLWAAALCAFAAGGAAGTLFFLFLRARRKKKHTSEGEKAEIGKLAFHLAMDSPEHNAELIAKETSTRIVAINPLAYDWKEEMLRIAQTLNEQCKKNH